MTRNRADPGNTAGDHQMKTRQTRAILWMSTACLLVGAAAVVGWHLASPPTIGSTARDAVAPPPNPVTDSPAPADRVDPASLRRVAGKNIRQQLFDPPVAVPKPPPPKPLPPIELISTILGDQGQHRAWVRDGQTLRKIVAGDTLGTADNPAVVESIGVDRLVVRHEARQVEVAQQAANGRRR